jgi:hypothetical protein
VNCAAPVKQPEVGAAGPRQPEAEAESVVPAERSCVAVDASDTRTLRRMVAVWGNGSETDDPDVLAHQGITPNQTFLSMNLVDAAAVERLKRSRTILTSVAGMAPLHLACAQNDRCVVAMLLRQCSRQQRDGQNNENLAKKEDLRLDMQDACGKTPFFWACHPETCDGEIRNAAGEIRKVRNYFVRKDGQGNPDAFVPVMFQLVERAREICSSKRNSNTANTTTNTKTNANRNNSNRSDRNGTTTPASLLGLNLRTSVRKRTVLHKLLLADRVQRVKPNSEIVGYKPNVEPKLQHLHKPEPVPSNFNVVTETVRFLLNIEGIDPDIPDSHERTPLWHACERFRGREGDLDVVQALLWEDDKAEVEEDDKEEDIKLMIQMAEAQLRNLENGNEQENEKEAEAQLRILENGNERENEKENENENNNEQKQIGKKYEKKVRRFTKVPRLSVNVNFAGSDPDHPHHNQETPLHIAATSGHVEVVKELLLRRDIDPTKKDGDGRTPLEAAVAECNMVAQKGRRLTWDGCEVLEDGREVLVRTTGAVLVERLEEVIALLRKYQGSNAKISGE